MTTSSTRSETTDVSTASTAVPPAHRLRAILPRFGMVGLFILLLVVFSILRPVSFANSANLRTILVESAVLTILALAVMIPLIANDFDLSVASVLGLASILAAGLPAKQGLPVPVVIVAVLAVGAVVGLLHALLIVKFDLPSVVVSLGTSTVLGGIVLWYTGGAVLYEGVPAALTNLGSKSFLGLPLPVYYMIVVAAVLWFVLERRPWGRNLYAVGSSEVAARLAGVNTARTRATALIACSTLAALAGLVLTARVGSGNPSISNAYFLPAFAAAFLSLAAFRLGFFNPLGVVLSVYLLAVGVNGLTILGVPSWVEPVFNGTALIVAIGLARLSIGKSRRLVGA
ncbi:ABC transporter permease [Aeromicrobium tamlense]|uniref:ABC transporter permease n=1 Tax=Aeromicrobium tamlense TaxID=375541 RepID=A0A8I0FZT0_9ACTN|nr:ABC transporter permease [Aeromicrobium tamlense]MBD1272005.1 ABC transporter permease [Aeromicrobium tamlense]NYI38803.1 ribose transport system permease protein [Aeromicrobium tamlense]